MSQSCIALHFKEMSETEIIAIEQELRDLLSSDPDNDLDCFIVMSIIQLRLEDCGDQTSVFKKIGELISRYPHQIFVFPLYGPMGGGAI